MKGLTHLYPNEQVATNVYEYASKCSPDLPKHVLDCYQRTYENDPVMADMMICPLQAQTQVWIAKALGFQRSSFGSFPSIGNLVTILTARILVLEIGTYVGFSALTWAHAIEGHEDGKVVTLEFDPKLSQVARETFARTGTDRCIELVEGDARKSLQSLHARNLPPFDLVFIDADKTSYVTYLELILALSKPGSSNRLLRAGGIIMADNILWRGLVADASEANPWHDWKRNTPEDRQGLDEFNKKMKSEQRLDALLMPIFDGVGMARLKD